MNFFNDLRFTYIVSFIFMLLATLLIMFNNDIVGSGISMVFKNALKNNNVEVAKDENMTVLNESMAFILNMEMDKEDNHLKIVSKYLNESDIIGYSYLNSKINPLNDENKLKVEKCYIGNKIKKLRKNILKTIAKPSMKDGLFSYIVERYQVDHINQIPFYMGIRATNNVVYLETKLPFNSQIYNLFLKGLIFQNNYILSSRLLIGDKEFLKNGQFFTEGYLKEYLSRLAFHFLCIPNETSNREDCIKKEDIPDYILEYPKYILPKFDRNVNYLGFETFVQNIFVEVIEDIFLNAENYIEENLNDQPNVFFSKRAHMKSIMLSIIKNYAKCKSDQSISDNFTKLAECKIKTCESIKTKNYLEIYLCSKFQLMLTDEIEIFTD